jgi:NifU-like protein involved in Fe-S cluster formation
VTVDIAMKDGRVSDFAHDVKACALGQASSSIMARHVIGQTPEQLRRLRETMQHMLKDNGPPPTGEWADCEALLPVRDYKARHASTLLTFDAVVDAVGQIEAGNG